MAGNVIQGGVTQVGPPQKQPGVLDYMQMAASLMGQVQQYKANQAQMELAEQQKKAGGMAFLIQHKELAADKDTQELFGLTDAQVKAIMNMSPHEDDLLREAFRKGMQAKSPEEVQAAIPEVKKAYSYIDSLANAGVNATQAKETVQGSPTVFNGPAFVSTGFSQEGTKKFVFESLAKNRNELDAAMNSTDVTDYDKEKMRLVREQYQDEINRVAELPDNSMASSNIQGLNLGQETITGTDENNVQATDYYGRQSTPDQFLGTEEKKRIPSQQGKPEVNAPVGPTTRAKDAPRLALYESPVKEGTLKEPKKKGIISKLFGVLKRTDKKIEEGTATQADYVVNSKALDAVGKNIKQIPKKDIELKTYKEIMNDPELVQTYALLKGQQGVFMGLEQTKFPVAKPKLSPEQQLKYQELQLDRYNLLEKASNNLSKAVLDYNKTKRRRDPEFLMTTPGKMQAKTINNLLTELGFEKNNMYIQQNTDLNLWQRNLDAAGYFFAGKDRRPLTETVEVDTGLEIKAPILTAEELEKRAKEEKKKRKKEAKKGPQYSAAEQALIDELGY